MYLLPPEALSEDNQYILEKCDVWSFGILLWVSCFSIHPSIDSSLSVSIHRFFFMFCRKYLPLIQNQKMLLGLIPSTFGNRETTYLDLIIALLKFTPSWPGRYEIIYPHLSLIVLYIHLHLMYLILYLCYPSYTSCWNLDPDQRPSFGDLYSMLDQIVQGSSAIDSPIFLPGKPSIFCNIYFDSVHSLLHY